MNISVLISVYDKENPQYLKEAIASVINQTYKPKQIVIVKDGELTKKLDRIIYNYKNKFPELIDIYKLEQNQGLGFALRFGIEKCKCDYIARMDSDDISKNYRFEKQINYLEKNKDIDILGGYIQEFNKTMEKKLSIRRVPLNNEEIYAEIKKSNPFNHSTVIMKKKSVLEVGNYRDCKIEDYDLWIRMRKKNMKMSNLDDILVNYRTSYSMYKRRTGIKYLKGIIIIEKELLEYKIINKLEYIKNVIIRTFLAFIPSSIKMLLYPNIVRKLKWKIKN